MGEAGRVRAATVFPLDATVKRTLAVYREVLGV
jgi:hypothetical protein